jgi:hypothetical protein
MVGMVEDMADTVVDTVEDMADTPVEDMVVHMVLGSIQQERMALGMGKTGRSNQNCSLTA